MVTDDGPDRPVSTLGQGWHSGAERPEAEGKLQYHIRCRPGDVGRYVLLPGDPDRVPKIAAGWQNAQAISRSREFATYTGTFGGVALSACSTGVGGPSAAIAIEELAEVGADTFVRVGTCGAIPQGIEPGDLIVATGAVRWEGTSHEYVDAAYPAGAHHEVTLALIQAAEHLGHRYHVGVCASTASFHCGQSRPGFGGYSQMHTEERLENLRRAGVLCFEMEAATLFTLSGLFGLRAGAVFAAVANRTSNRFEYRGVDACIDVANEAVRILAEWDHAKLQAGKRYWYPGL